MTAAPVTAEQLAPAARAQAALPEATVSGVRPVWDHRLAGIWGVTVEADDERRNAFLRVRDGRVAVPAGLAHAARELRELGVLEGGSWDGGLIYIVTAVGGATPGFPDIWTTDEAPQPDGGVRVTVRLSEDWAAYAAAGGVGPPPPVSSALGGWAAPPPPGTATLDIAADYALRWSYQLGDDELEGPSGAPAAAPPALRDDELVAALDGARRRAGAPRAMPVGEPGPLDDRRDILRVDLWALGPVYVPATGAAVAAEALGAADPAALVPRLSAADALPPGIVPDDLRAAEIAGGELTAELPAPLLQWSAGGARVSSPRVRGVVPADDMSRLGRLRIPLDDPSDYKLEVP
jgi:hypothetical protein